MHTIRKSDKYLKEMGAKLDKEIELAQKEVYKAAGGEIDINSPKQLRELLYDKMKLELPKEYKTPKGDPSTAVAAMNYIADTMGIDIAKKILKVRELGKINSTYVKGLLDKHKKGVIHAQFRQTGTVTGHLSCVPIDSQILTEKGWKKWNEIKIGDYAMGYSLIREKYEWTRIINIHKGIDSLGLIKTNRGHDRKYRKGLWCTKNHRWVIRNKKWVGFSKAFAIQRKHRVIIIPKNNFPDTEESLLNKYESALLGWYLTDGFTTGKKNFGLGINLAKKRSIEILERLLAGKEFTTHKYQPYDTDNHYITAFHISSKVFSPLYNILKSMTPSQFIMSLNEKSRRSMFEAMLEADGSMRRDAKRYDRFGALKVQPKNTCEYFELLSVSLGQPYTVTERRAVTLRKPFMDYNLLQSELYSDENSLWKEELKNQDVWCPETECGTWVMKQGNQIAITGNSSDY